MLNDLHVQWIFWKETTRNMESELIQHLPGRDRSENRARKRAGRAPRGSHNTERRECNTRSSAEQGEDKNLVSFTEPWAVTSCPVSAICPACTLVNRNSETTPSLYALHIVRAGETQLPPNASRRVPDKKVFVSPVPRAPETNFLPVLSF